MKQADTIQQEPPFTTATPSSPPAAEAAPAAPAQVPPAVKRRAKVTPLAAVPTDLQGAKPTAEAEDMPAVIDALGKLPAGAIISEAGLADIFKRCTASVKAEVDRGGLPRPVRIFGKNCWTAGSIIQHIEELLHAEARKFSRLRT